MTPLKSLFWTSGFQSQGGFRHLYALLPVCTGFIKIPSSVTPADHLVASMATRYAYKHWWGLSQGSSMPLPHSMWQGRCPTNWVSPARLMITTWLTFQMLILQYSMWMTQKVPRVKILYSTKDTVQSLIFHHCVWNMHLWSLELLGAKQLKRRNQEDSGMINKTGNSVFDKFNTLFSWIKLLFIIVK